MSGPALGSRTILVTGAEGFVGTRLVPRLEHQGARVVAAVLDVTDAEAVARAVAEVRPDAVVHLAALSFVPESLAHPEAVYRVNYLGTHAVLEAARRAAAPPRVLFASTGHVYGPAPPEAPPFDETAPLRPASPYAWSKAAADRLGRLYGDRGVPVVRLRLFNHTGPGRPDRFVESSFARQIAEIEAGQRTAVLEVGNLDAVRDFLDVDDALDAYVAALDPALPPGVYNVASGRGTRIRDLLDALLALSDARPEIRVDRARWRPADASVGSAERLTRTSGWCPRRALAATLRALLDDWRAAVASGAGGGARR